MGSKFDYKGSTDSELITLLNDGDALAFGEITERYTLLLTNFAYRRVGDLSLAEDIVYDVWADLWERRETNFIKITLLPYLFTIVRNRILDYIRRQKVSEKYMDHFRASISNDPPPSDYLVIYNDLAALIEKEIAALPENMRIVFELHRNRNMTRKEVAEFLNMPENSVKSNMQRALKILKGRLGDSFTLFLF